MFGKKHVMFDGEHTGKPESTPARIPSVDRLENFLIIDSSEDVVLPTSVEEAEEELHL